ncbi:hypothetical protein FF38_00258 [Lucilia cuprina]|uniref:Uncharacterized protein n=1 Tax=Lucilia cuprina TaxID=7375 RepID=A0A0L0CMY8_LUCCU|nr:hypothetical protein FF38_00258 [Lucilia cuprina]
MLKCATNANTYNLRSQSQTSFFNGRSDSKLSFSGPTTSPIHPGTASPWFVGVQRVPGLLMLVLCAPFWNFMFRRPSYMTFHKNGPSTDPCGTPAVIWYFWTPSPSLILHWWRQQCIFPCGSHTGYTSYQVHQFFQRAYSELGTKEVFQANQAYIMMISEVKLFPIVICLKLFKD